jgi:ABC-type multidrug transport system fused ATPase/permease subunit
MTESSKDSPLEEEEEEVDDVMQSSNGKKSSFLSSSMESAGDHDKESASAVPQLASISDVFSYGDGWIKFVCLTLGFFLAMVSGAVAPALIFYFAKAFEELVADPQDEEFMKQIRELAYTFLVLGVIAFCSLCGYATLLETSAGNMAKDFQQKWFRALIRQDMAYFDILDVSGVSTLISTNGNKYKR